MGRNESWESRTPIWKKSAREADVFLFLCFFLAWFFVSADVSHSQFNFHDFSFWTSSSQRRCCQPTTQWLRRTSTQCCHHCQTTWTTIWRRSLSRLFDWWKTRSPWWGRIRALPPLNSCCFCAIKWSFKTPFSLMKRLSRLSRAPGCESVSPCDTSGRG